MELWKRLQGMTRLIPALKKIDDILLPAERQDALFLAYDLLQQLSDEEHAAIPGYKHSGIGHRAFNEGLGFGFILGLQCAKPHAWVFRLMEARARDGEIDPRILHDVAYEVLASSIDPDEAVATLRFLFTACAFDGETAKQMLVEAGRVTEIQLTEYDSPIDKLLRELEDS